MAGWLAASADEESRAYLQERLRQMSKFMFWSFVMLLAFMVIVYATYPAYQPRFNWVIYTISTIGLVLLGITWRVFLERYRLSIGQLQAIDAFYLVGTGSIFGASGVLAYDLRPSAYICLIYACLLVLLRSTIVPSTRRRTAIVSALACAPMTAGTIALVFLWPQDIPGPAYVAGGILACAMAIVLATFGSKMLYDFRVEAAHLRVLGQYTLGAKIGFGGNGAVFHAHHALLRRPTAIKMMHGDLVDANTLDRFEREVQVMSQLTHPNWVAVFDYGRSPDGVFYYAMEYLDGIDLQKLVQRYGAQPAERVIPILIQVCGALQEAHRRGFTHRDIKPGNIIIAERGFVPDVAKVLDFGLVKEITSAPERNVMGTPGYVAPEVVTNPHGVGPPVDVYALGAVAYFLLAGRQVFDGKSSLELCTRHVTDAPTPVRDVAPGVTRELEAIVMRCLSKHPEERPTSAELAAELRALSLGPAWDAEVAQRWWEEFRSRQVVVDVTSPTETITVDVAHRSAKAA